MRNSPAPLAAVSAPGFLHRLEKLRLVVRRTLATRPGNTPMPQGSQPTGMELARYKDYSAGDDLRYLDWNAFGRLDQLLVRTFRAEREAPLHVFLDTSASMTVPASDGKLAFAAALVAALAYVSLRQQDPVRIICLGGDLPCFRASRFFAHVQRLPELHSVLLAVQATGRSTLREGIEGYLAETRAPGVAVVISDFLLERTAYEHALGLLLARGFSVAALRVIGPVEREPQGIPRRVQLRDAENGAERRITWNMESRDRYAAALQEHLGALERWCHARQVAHAVLDTSRGLESCLFADLIRAGLLH